MDPKIIKITDKGQITLPAEFRKKVGAKKGDSLIIIEEQDTLILKKIDSFKDLLKHSEKVAEKIWDNEEDEIWNTV
jgi:AbrB family looped-hinge helix DNA binding protein